MLYLVAIFIFSSTLGAALWFAARKGKYEERAKAQEEHGEKVEDGLNVQDRVVADAEYRERVRDKYK